MLDSRADLERQVGILVNDVESAPPETLNFLGVTLTRKVLRNDYLYTCQAGHHRYEISLQKGPIAYWWVILPLGRSCRSPAGLNGLKLARDDLEAFILATGFPGPDSGAKRLTLWDHLDSE